MKKANKFPPMANHRIPKAKRALILSALFEGAAVNSICRMFGVGKNNVLRFLLETGEACEAWHDKHFRNLSLERLEIDEQWAYCFKHKERMSKEEKMDHPERGDCWLWASMDHKSRAIINWKTGKRGFATAYAFSYDLADRVVGEVQITSDALACYRMTIPKAFGRRAHYATERKEFHKAWVADTDYLKRRVDSIAGVTKKRISGSPKLSLATVAHIERYFLTVRQGNKRCARKTLAHSKLWENHAAVASVHNFLYNLVRKHEALDGKTPAQKLGVADKRWTFETVVDMVDAHQKAKEEAAFAAPKFNVVPTAKRTWEPVAPVTPWYLDANSGGPNPHPVRRIPGVRYQDGTTESP
jgi:IS1 family transposase